MIRATIIIRVISILMIIHFASLLHGHLQQLVDARIPKIEAAIDAATGVPSHEH